MTTKALRGLVILQFAMYSALSGVAFAAWALAITRNLAMAEWIIGDYIGGHLVRWTTRLPYWGVYILFSGALSLGSVWLLCKSHRAGVYSGIVAFALGFITNIAFAQNLLVHALIGALIGWTLLTPLALLWRDLESESRVSSAS